MQRRMDGSLMQQVNSPGWVMFFRTSTQNGESKSDIAAVPVDELNITGESRGYGQVTMNDCDISSGRTI